jgi:hypothetical protein
MAAPSASAPSFIFASMRASGFGLYGCELRYAKFSSEIDGL